MTTKQLKSYLLALLSALVLPNLYAAPSDGPYVLDEQRFYVAGQPVTDAIETANRLMCYLANMRPDAFVSDGAYQAKVYEERCIGSGADATSEAASALVKSSQSAASANSSKAAADLETETALTATLIVEPLAAAPDDAFVVQPMKVTGWVDLLAQDEQDIDTRVYLGAEIASGATERAPNGVFEMRWSIHSQGLPSWFLADAAQDQGEAPPDQAEIGQIPLGQGVLKVSGAELKFKEYGNELEANLALNYLANGDITGVYGQAVRFCLDCDAAFEVNETPSYRTFSTFHQFFVDNQNKQYCSALDEVYETCYTPEQNETCAEAFSTSAAQNAGNADYDPYRMIKLPVARSALEALAAVSEGQAVQTEEVCYSLKQSDAQRNVFRYGVYEQTGARVSTGGSGSRSAFPMVASVETEVPDPNESGATIVIEERVFGYADYWGVFIDPRGRRLVEPGVTQFKAEVFGDSAQNLGDEFFTVAETEVQIEKRTKSFRSLESLNKLKLALYVQDPQWAAEYEKLLGVDVFAEDAYSEYEGYFDASLGKFIFDKGLRFLAGYAFAELESPITFTPADWISKMKKEQGFGVDDGGETLISNEVRSMGVWSNDTRQWYDISPAGLSDPSLADPVGEASDVFDSFDKARGGVATESIAYTSPADLTEDLVCLQDCLTPEKVQATFIYAYCAQVLKETGQVDAAECPGFQVIESGGAPSPFADGGPYLTEDITVIRVDDDEVAKTLVEGFYLSDAGNQIGRQGFRLASGNVQVIDYVYVAKDEAQGIKQARTLPKYLRMEKRSVSEGRLWLDFVGGLNVDNLNRVLGNTGGTVPVMTFDLQSAPAIATSGTTNALIKLCKPSGDSCERSLSATVPVIWTGTQDGFTLMLAAGTSYDVVLESGSVNVAATLTNSADQVFGYTGGVLSNDRRPGFTLKLMSLLTGEAGSLSNLELPSFFEVDTDYRLALTFGDEFTFREIKDSGSAELDLTGLTMSFTTTGGESAYNAEKYQAGEWWDGINNAALVRYQATSSGFTVGSESLSKGALVNAYLRRSKEPFTALGEASYTRPDGRREPLNWGLQTGQLVAASDLSKLECNKFSGNYEDHPGFTAEEETETRYCIQKMFESPGLTTYSISLAIQPSYALLDASGEPVTIAAPRTLFYQVPSEARFGRDSGKRLSLEFSGHGELRGVPGFIYDTVTGEDKGEFVNEWKDSYRYLSRFTIPDGSTVTDLAGVEYFVKALDGEAWLKALDVGVSAEDQYTLTVEDLVQDDELAYLGSPGEPAYIGEPPTCVDPDVTQTCALLNKGAPVVVHGELIVDADPTP